MAREKVDVLELLRKRSIDGDVAFLREALDVLVAGIMDGEASVKTGAVGDTWMRKLAPLVAMHILLVIGGGAVLACSNPSLAPTPIQPSTPLPPATPRAAQYSSVQAMPAHGLYVTTKNLSDTREGSSDDLSKLVAFSSLIVVGTVSAQNLGVVRIHDPTPDDSSSSIRNVQSVGNVYDVQVERYLKGGDGAQSISVVQFIGLDYKDRGQTKQARSEDKYLLPVKNSRYLFFLTEQVDTEGHWIGIAQPYKFLLTGGRASAESPVGNLQGAFPVRSEVELITHVKSLIAEGS